MSFPRYPAYKDSGVEWLGEVPSHWVGPRKFGEISSLKGRLGWQGLKADEYREEGPFVVSSAHFSNFKIRWDECPHVSRERYETDANIQLSAEDILLMKDGAALGKLAFVDKLPGAACLNSHLLLFRPLHHGEANTYIPKFAFYFMQTPLFQEFMQTRGTGATFMGVSQETISRHQVYWPTQVEQRTIASFLDRETAKIDALVAEQEQLTILLKEKRQAVISHAVTKGLDPSVPMKDSGVEWLGAVPEHWDVGRIKHVVASFEQGWSPQCENFPVESDSDWGVLKVGCVNGGIFKPEENKALPPDLTAIPELGICLGDLLISRANTRELVGSAAVVPADHQNLLLCDKLYRLRLTPSLCLPGFLSLFLSTELARGQIELAATGASSSMVNIAQSTILEMAVPLPPVAEQAMLLSTVEQRTLEQDQLIGEVVLSIELLRERRSALISAAVTGQIDVRGLGPAHAP